MADNSLAKARDFGLLSGKNRVRNAVGRTDKLDFYQFNISGQQTLSLKLKSPRFSDINFSLLNSSGATIGKGDRSNGRTKPINTTLQTGIYYIRVRSASNKPVRYSLVSEASVPTTIPSVPGMPSGSGVPPAPVPSTVDVGILTGTQILPRQAVGGSANPTDSYRFTLSQIGSFNATVSNVIGNAAMQLYLDSNGNGVADSSESFLSGSGSNGASSPVSATALPAGNYILQVKSNSFNNSVGYDLILSTTQNPGNISPDPGSEAPTAFALGSLPNTLVAKDYIGELDNVDVYRFTVNTVVTANINVGSISENSVDVTLFKDNNTNNLIDSGERVTSRIFSSGSVAQTISRTLDAGTYFLSVDRRGFSDNLVYTLTIQG
ncbi:MAG: hypothetical protein KME11_09360 [Timaviella obliquedivisa GSE-PSE-MK23-08B]|nr:hypothetical protein [Timaviella obliquedivisa GSE-PSE-MK23-08B]